MSYPFTCMTQYTRRTRLRSPAGCIALCVAGLVLYGCANDKPASYKQEDFGSATGYTHDYAASTAATCEAARRALLSQGYVVSQMKSDLVDARKSFQPEADSHVEIEFHVTCAANGKTTTAFVNALQDRFAIKKTNASASVGVGAIGAVSLPFGSSDDSLVKVASETIPSGKLYERFFSMVDHYLAETNRIGIDKSELDHPDPSKNENLLGPENMADPAAVHK